MRVGDKVQFRGRVGTVKGFQPAGMVDVAFDGAIERRAKSMLTPVKSNPKAKIPTWVWVAGAVLVVGGVVWYVTKKD